ncbi:MAG: HAMP domain-containing histidine kinase [Crocinitomicaceae bacterium]|nr:HAMP domain-containing histidine kinase [Crocinitomicaceae bacterium]
MKNFRFSFVTISVAIALFSLVIIQVFQVVQLYDRKNFQFKRKLSTSLERIALQHEKAEDMRRYMQIVNKDFSGQYKDILKEEFQNLLSLQESISIKDTSILENDGPHDYLLIKGRSFDSISGVSAEHRVLARDVRQLRQLFDRQNKKIPTNDSMALSIQLDQKVLQHIFKKAKFVNEMMVETFRNNVYASPSERVDVEFLDSLIHKEFAEDELPANYRFMVEDQNDLPVQFNLNPKNYDLSLDTNLTVYSRIALFPSNMLDDSLVLHVYFPSKLTFLFKEMLGSIGVTLTLVLIIVVTLIFMMRTIQEQRRLDEMKTDFISNMTHEFKTPISTISLACEAMSDSDMLGDSVNQTRPYVRMIDEENKRLSLLVERILQSAVLEKGKAELKKEFVLLNTMVYDAVENVKLKVRSMNGQISLDLPKEEMTVYADKMHLNNCLSNLLDNAIKYSKDAPQIEVVVTSDKASYQISVKDHGLGIRKEHIDKIFDKLYRVPTGNVHNVKGFGLGLSYVKSIIELHKWDLTVKSAFGEGTTFTIKINKD